MAGETMDQTTGQHAPGCCTPARANGDEARNGGVAVLPRNANGPHRDMANLPGGPFFMGTDDTEGFPEDGEGPIREVTVRPFLIDCRAVTNARFAEFVQATRYRTEAERFGWSYVFQHFVSQRSRQRVVGVSGQARWWLAVKGANWSHPEGPDSNLRKRENHPVTHVS
jgi:formylglycine-generating enzyme